MPPILTVVLRCLLMGNRTGKLPRDTKVSSALDDNERGPVRRRAMETETSGQNAEDIV